MLFLCLTSPAISLIGCFPALIGIRPFDYGEIACLIGISCVGVPMAALVVYILIIKHRLKKKIYLWMEDAVSLYAESFAVSRIRFRMPGKNKTNLAKTPLFPCFPANSRLKYKSTSALAFTGNHQKYRRFGCGQV